MASPTHHRCVTLTSLHDQLPTENAAIHPGTGKHQ
jgi:hypothetical protein